MDATAFRIRRKQLCKNLAAARKKAGLTQTELAAKSGTTQYTLSFWETGKSNPTLSALVLVCDVLGVPITRYLEGKPPKPVQTGTPFGGESMRRCRRKAGLTQKELGERSGVCCCAIGQYERNEASPTLLSLERLCAVLGVDIDEYVGYAPKTS